MTPLALLKSPPLVHLLLCICSLKNGLLRKLVQLEPPPLLLWLLSTIELYASHQPKMIWLPQKWLIVLKYECWYLCNSFINYFWKLTFYGGMTRISQKVLLDDDISFWASLFLRERLYKILFCRDTVLSLRFI